jgi:hypothetical protein
MAPRRIFSDLGDEVVPMFSNLLIKDNRRVVSKAREWLAFQTIDGEPVPSYKIPYFLKIPIIIYMVIVSIPMLPLLAGCYIVLFLYGCGGPVSCIGLALWRILQRDYGSNDGDITKANLAPALDVFYCLILCQGALYIVWLYFHILGGAMVIFSYSGRSISYCKLPPRLQDTQKVGLHMACRLLFLLPSEMLAGPSIHPRQHNEPLRRRLDRL